MPADPDPRPDSGPESPGAPAAPQEHPDADASSKPEGRGASSPTAPAGASLGRTDKLPIKMLQDRLLVHIELAEGERRSTGGILIPATAQLGKRLQWAEVRAAGPNVRNVEVGDQVLFNPEDLYEVELAADTFIILRERDIHAVASGRLETGSTGLYL